MLPHNRFDKVTKSSVVVNLKIHSIILIIFYMCFCFACFTSTYYDITTSYFLYLFFFLLYYMYMDYMVYAYV